MKSCVLIVAVAFVALLQTANCQYIRQNIALPGVVAPSLIPSCASSPLLLPNVVAPNVIPPYQIQGLPSNVGASLADTLSLLTVSNLLADKLPYNQCQLAGIPVAAPVLGGCGCGYNGVYY